MHETTWKGIPIYDSVRVSSAIPLSHKVSGVSAVQQTSPSGDWIGKQQRAGEREGENGRQSVMEGDWHDKGHPQLIIKFVPFVRDLGKTWEGLWSNLNTIL